MEKRLLAIWLMFMVSVVMAEKVNKSVAGGLFWSTAEEKGNLLPQGDPTESAPLFDKDEFDGGFSSLDGMLQWAIGHSDPAKLEETAKSVQQLSPEELKKRQTELKELMEKLKTPSDAKLMQIALDDLNNSSMSLEDHHRALQELLILVEPIDNANDLNKLGGLSVIIRELDNSDLEIRMTSAWILGKASQNNPAVQNQVIEHGGLAKLIKMVGSGSVEEATKALYAVSALIRNNLAGQKMFYAEAGELMLQDILSNPSGDIRVVKKCVFLVADLAEGQLESGSRAEPSFFGNPLFLKSVVNLTATADLDLQEKALVAIKNLLQLRTTEALVSKDLCGLEIALERMRQQLQQLVAEDDEQEDYARDVENLRTEVESIFREKQQKVLHHLLGK